MPDRKKLLQDFYAKYAPNEQLTDERLAAIDAKYKDNDKQLLLDFYAKYAPEQKLTDERYNAINANHTNIDTVTDNKIIGNTTLTDTKITNNATMTPTPKIKLQIIIRTCPQLKRSFFKDLYNLTDLIMFRSLFEF